MVTDELQGAVDMPRRLAMERDDVGACLREGGHELVNGLDHQMHVHGHLGVRTNCLEHERANGQIRNVVVVHHVEVDPVGAAFDNVAHLLPETGEVGGKNGRGNSAKSHD